MSKSQKGIGILPVLLVIILVSAVVGVGWYVWNKNQDKKPAITNFDECAAAGNPIMESYPEQCRDDGRTFVNEKNDLNQDGEATKTYSRYAISFKYPIDWALVAHDDTQSQSTDLVSPEGGRIYIAESSFSAQGVAIAGLTADNFEDRVLKNNPNPYSGFKIIDIDSRKAVRFVWEKDNPQEPGHQVIVFRSDGKTVSIVMDYVPNDSDISTEFEQIVQSVKFD